MVILTTAFFFLMKEVSSSVWTSSNALLISWMFLPASSKISFASSFLNYGT